VGTVVVGSPSVVDASTPASVDGSVAVASVSGGPLVVAGSLPRVSSVMSEPGGEVESGALDPGEPVVLVGQAPLVSTDSEGVSLVSPFVGSVTSDVSTPDAVDADVSSVRAPELVSG